MHVCEYRLIVELLQIPPWCDFCSYVCAYYSHVMETNRGSTETVTCKVQLIQDLTQLTEASPVMADAEKVIGLGTTTVVPLHIV